MGQREFLDGSGHYLFCFASKLCRYLGIEELWG